MKLEKITTLEVMNLLRRDKANLFQNENKDKMFLIYDNKIYMKGGVHYQIINQKQFLKYLR